MAKFTSTGRSSVTSGSTKVFPETHNQLLQFLFFHGGNCIFQTHPLSGPQSFFRAVIEQATGFQRKHFDPPAPASFCVRLQVRVGADSLRGDYAFYAGLFKRLAFGRFSWARATVEVLLG